MYPVPCRARAGKRKYNLLILITHRSVRYFYLALATWNGMDPKEIEKLTQLARIKVSPEEQNLLGKDLKSILKYISIIQDVAGGDPSFDVPAHRNVLREDGEPDLRGVHAEDLLQGVPKKEGEYVKVKKIL